MASSPDDQIEKKKNKLGYHRQSVACSHCRRRKIRCLPSEYFEGKCENCLRTGKNCHFIKVSDESPALTPRKVQQSSEVRSRSFSDHQSQRISPFSAADSSQFLALAERTRPVYQSGYGSCDALSGSPTVVPTMQQLQHDYREGPDTWLPEHKEYRKPSVRPRLLHRATEPLQMLHRSNRMSPESMDEVHQDMYNQSVYHFGHPRVPIHAAAGAAANIPHAVIASGWPLYDASIETAAMSCSTSERSASIEGIVTDDFDVYAIGGVRPGTSTTTAFSWPPHTIVPQCPQPQPQQNIYPPLHEQHASQRQEYVLPLDFMNQHSYDTEPFAMGYAYMNDCIDTPRGTLQYPKFWQA